MKEQRKLKKKKNQLQAVVPISTNREIFSEWH